MVACSDTSGTWTRLVVMARTRREGLQSIQMSRNMLLSFTKLARCVKWKVCSRPPDLESFSADRDVALGPIARSVGGPRQRVTARRAPSAPAPPAPRPPPPARDPNQGAQPNRGWSEGGCAGRQRTLEAMLVRRGPRPASRRPKAEASPRYKTRGGVSTTRQPGTFRGPIGLRASDFLRLWVSGLRTGPAPCGLPEPDAGRVMAGWR